MKFILNENYKWDVLSYRIKINKNEDNQYEHSINIKIDFEDSSDMSFADILKLYFTGRCLLRESNENIFLNEDNYELDHYERSFDEDTFYTLILNKTSEGENYGDYF